jgi:hypothetical protein
MSSRPRRAKGRGPLRKARAGWALGFATLLTAVTAGGAVLFVATAREARADEDSDLREEFVKGGPGRWQAVLKDLARSPARTGIVLGPVFRDRSVRSSSAFAAAWLADHAPKGEPPLLIDDILRRIQGDPAYVEELRADLTPDGPGWGAIALGAKRRLTAAGTDPSLKSAAAWALRYETTKANAKELAEAWENGVEQVKATAGESLEFLLAYRFVKGPPAAKKWFAEHDTLTFAEWVRDLSMEKDRPTAPLYARMVSEARSNVERAVSPEDLKRYLLPSETPWVEVRQLAARRAAKIEAPGEAWLPLLVQVLREEKDGPALLSLLDVARRLKVDSKGAASEVARLVVARLDECCPKQELAIGLLRVLGTVGDPQTVAQAYDILERSPDPAVQDVWLSIAGSVGGNEARLVRLYQSRQNDDDEAKVRLRVRALEAMAQGAGRGGDGDVLVGDFLRAILRRTDASEAEARLPRETAPAARAVAIRGLEAFPDSSTVARLRDDVVRSRDEEAPLQLLGVGVLGKLAAELPEAAIALAEIARSDAAIPVRVEALKDLAKALGEAPAEEARERTVEAARAVLAANAGPREVRVAALQVAAALADPGSLPAAFDLAVESAQESASAVDPDLSAGLDRLTQGIARASEAQDAALVEGMERLARAGGLDRAIVVADGVADAGGGRLRLQAGRAGLLARRARTPGREATARADLEAAHRILRTIESSAAPAERGQDPWKAALTLHDEILSSILEDPGIEVALRRECLLSTLEVAAYRGDQPSAKRALGVVDTLRALGLAGSEAKFEQLVVSLQTLANPAVPNPK